MGGRDKSPFPLWVTKCPLYEWVFLFKDVMNQVAAHAYYGQPVTGIRPAAQQDGSKLAAPSAPYVGRNRCIANDDTCEGPRAKGTEYCVGHLRSVKKAESE